MDAKMTKDSLIALEGLTAEKHIRTAVDWIFGQMRESIERRHYTYGFSLTGSTPLKRDNTYSDRLNSHIEATISEGITNLVDVLDMLAKKHAFKPLATAPLATLRQHVALPKVTISVPDTRLTGAAAGGAGGGAAGTIFPIIGTIFGATTGAMAGFLAGGTRDENETKRRIEQAALSAGEQLERRRSDAARLIIEHCLSL